MALRGIFLMAKWAATDKTVLHAPAALHAVLWETWRQPLQNHAGLGRQYLLVQARPDETCTKLLLMPYQMD